MKTFASKLAAVLLLTLLTACGVVGGGVAQNLASIPQERGLVVFSTSASQTSVATSVGLILVQGSSMKAYDKVAININSPVLGSDFKDLHGKVRSLLLPSGDYYLVPKVANPFFLTKQAPVFKFSVTAGQASYIGNIHFSNGELHASNAFQARDIGHFRMHNPAFHKMSFVDAPLAQSGLFSEFKVQGTIWQAL